MSTGNPPHLHQTLPDRATDAPLPHSTALYLRNLAALFIAAVGLAFLAALYFSSTLGHDQAWCLYAANRMMDGATIYGPTLVETNPPLVLWFSLIPVALSRIGHLSPAVALHVVILALAGLSGCFCSRILARAHPLVPPLQRLLLSAVIFTVVCAVIPAELGQREQLLVLLLLPCLIAYTSGPASVLTKFDLATVGCLAAVGVCFKPQQITVLVALQLGVLLAHGPSVFFRRREWIAVFAAFSVCLLYVAAVRFLTPAYLLTLTPILVDTYWALGRYTFLQIMRSQQHFPQILLFTTLVFLGGRRLKLLSTLPGFFLLAAAGACVGYGIQHTGFPYHRIPQNTFVELAILSIAIELGVRFIPALFVPARVTWPQAAVSAVGFAALFLSFARARTAEFNPPLPAHSIQGFFRSLPPGTVVWSLTVDLSAQFPDVLTDHLVWGSRFNHLWMLPAIQQNLAFQDGGPRPAKVLPAAIVSSLETLQRQSSVDDLARWRPQFILVPRCERTADCLGFSAPFDSLHWFRQSAAFDAAWLRYRYRDTLPNLHNGAIFDLYERY